MGLREKWDEFKEDRKVKEEYAQQTKVKSREAYSMEKQEQSIRVAKERAKIEADARIQRYKAKYSPAAAKKPGMGAAGVAGGLMAAAQGAGNFLMGGQPPPRTTAKPPVRHRKPSRKKKSKKQRRTTKKKTIPQAPQMGYKWGF